MEGVGDGRGADLGGERLDLFVFGSCIRIIVALHVNRRRRRLVSRPDPRFLFPALAVAHPIILLGHHAKTRARAFRVSALVSCEPPYLDIWAPRRAERRECIHRVRHEPEP